MKNILLLFGKNNDHKELKTTLKDPNFAVHTDKYTNIGIYLDNSGTQLSISDTDLTDFDYLMFFVLPENRYHIVRSLECLLPDSTHIIDSNFPNPAGKLYEMSRLHAAGLPIPQTAFGPVDFLARILEEKLGGRGILKDAFGTKGRSNYLVNSTAELRQIIADNPDTQFILQNFISNSGDWRIVCIDYQPRLAIYRSSVGNDHRNNTSVGGNATNPPLSEVDPAVLSLAEQASEALNIRFSGADIIKNDETGELSILEVNRTPQFISGAFLDAKQAALLKYLQELPNRPAHS